MGINVGAFFSPLVCGFLAQSETFSGWLAQIGIARENAWHFGFGAAAVGMFLGLVQYRVGDKDLGDAGKYPVPPENSQEAARNRLILKIILGGLAAVAAASLALALSPIQLSVNTLTIGVLVLLAAVPGALFVALFTVAKWSGPERKRIFVILLLFFGAAVFFADFEQAGSTFNLFAQRNSTNEFFGIEFPASFLQSVNAGFILILAPIFAWMWTALGKRGKNPSHMAKFAIGMFLLALGCLVMVPPAIAAESGAKSSANWLIMLYFLHTCAELCVSPVGLSSTTKLAPARIAGLAMGIWFAGTALGNYLSGVAVGMTSTLGQTTLFIAISVPPLVAALIFALLIRPVRRMLARQA
jgi:POT family proton-dependent oligopeptide transporter